MIVAYSKVALVDARGASDPNRSPPFRQTIAERLEFEFVANAGSIAAGAACNAPLIRRQSRFSRRLAILQRLAMSWSRDIRFVNRTIRSPTRRHSRLPCQSVFFVRFHARTNVFFDSSRTVARDELCA